MDKFFGGKDPFDDPFFTQPFGGLFGGKSPFDDPFFTPTFDHPFFTGQFDNRSDSRKQITIEELNGDGDGGPNASRNNMPSKEVSVKNSSEYPAGAQSFSFHGVAYGGLDGMYYTSSVGKRSGGDGVFLMEMKEEDRRVGESMHTLSKGIRDKGHSVTTKQFSDGKVDSMQTLHNLEEDELTGFQEDWKRNAGNLPGWNNGFNLLENGGLNINSWDDFFGWGGWPHPSLEYFGNGGAQSDGESQSSSSRGKSKRIVPVE